MVQISHHATLRYAQRFMDFTELESECMTTLQYKMIRNFLSDKLENLNVSSAIIIDAERDMRLVIVENVLVTVTTI
jgi:hypothetical protein